MSNDQEAASCRLYLITPPDIGGEAAAGFADTLAAALDAGDVACVQLRLKEDADTIRRAADILRPITQDREVAFILNDNPGLARELGCDGVHVGQDDVPCHEARDIMGDDSIVGVTCHDSFHLAMEAGEAGADYVAFGAFFESGTKQRKFAPEPDLLARWSAATIIPSVAIGGITVENCAPLVEAGADFLAISAGIWKHPDGPAAAVKAFNAILDR